MIRADSGQAAMLAVGVMMTAGAGMFAAARLGVAAHDAARARTAADAAALAGAMRGRSGAAAMAKANGAVLVRFGPTSNQLGADVVVEVRVGAARATARATPGS